MSDFTLFELHFHDGFSISTSAEPEPGATEPPVKTESRSAESEPSSRSESSVSDGFESQASGFPLKAIGVLAMLGLLVAAAVAYKLKSGEVPDVDELSDAL